MPHIRQVSWPPTQVRLTSPREEDNVVVADTVDLAMDDDPLTYFLTPTPALDDEEDGDMEMDFGFDAGVGEGNSAPEIVRSVSPSSLDGMSLPPPRPPTPPRSPPARLSPDPESATDEDEDDDDDDDECIRFGIGRHHSIGIPFSLRDFASMKMKKAVKGRAAAGDLLSPSSPPLPHAPKAAVRGRPTARYGSSPPGSRYGSTRGRTRSFSGRRSPHAWREPSPDVWSIEEETEAEMNSEGGSIIGSADLMARRKVEATKRLDNTLDDMAAKPKKRVRFVLPVKEG